MRFTPQSKIRNLTCGRFNLRTPMTVRTQQFLFDPGLTVVAEAPGLY
jgi:hypothetical protein